MTAARTLTDSDMIVTLTRGELREIAGWLSASGDVGDGGVVAAIELLGRREAARVYAAARGE